MTLRSALRWCFAFFFACLCYFSAQSWLAGQGFTAALHYEGEGRPVYSAYDVWRDELYENPESEVMASAAWSKGGRGYISTEIRGITVDLYYAKGSVDLILPVRMLSGHMPADDPASIALDNVSAFNLTGTSAITGLQIRLNEKEYTVCGIFEAPKGLFAWGNDTGYGMALLSPEQGTPLDALGMVLSKSPQETTERARQLSSALGSAGYIEDRQLLAGFMRQIGLLPLWIGAFAAMIPLLRGAYWYFRRGPMFDPLLSALPQRLWDKFLRVLFLAAALGICYGLLRLTDFSPEIPTAWLPTRWSDFSHWPALLARLGETWASARLLPTLRPELMRWTLCGVAALSCAGALALRPPAVKQAFPAHLALSALVPAAALALCAYLQAEIRFAPELIVLPTACVFAQWTGHALGEAEDFQGVKAWPR